MGFLLEGYFEASNGGSLVIDLGLDIFEAVRLEVYLLDLETSLAELLPTAVCEEETHVDVVAFSGVLQLDHILEADLYFCLDFISLFNDQFSSLLREAIFVDVSRLYANYFSGI